MAMSNTFHSSAKGHAIGGAGKLSSVARHNDRGYFSFEYSTSKIQTLVGTQFQIMEDTVDYINRKFQPAIDAYNEKQTREDRKIKKTPFEYFCDNKNLDVANEVILQLGDKDFWSAVRKETMIVRNGKTRVLKDYSDAVKNVMNDIFKKQAEAYVSIYKTDKGKILSRIQQDYEFSKKMLSSLSEDETRLFTKIEKMKIKDKKKAIGELSDEQKEKFETYLSATATVDFVERKRIIERIENDDMEIKMINLTAHYDEWSPHAHAVSVCSVRGYEKGINERVAKSVVLNKWTLSVLQDKMHEIAKSEMEKYPGLFDEPLKDKEMGRDYNYTSEEWTRKQIEKLKEDVRLYSTLADSATNRALDARAQADAACAETEAIIERERRRAADARAEADAVIETTIQSKEEYMREVSLITRYFQGFFDRLLEVVLPIANAVTADEINKAVDVFRDFYHRAQEKFRQIGSKLKALFGYEEKTNMPKEERQAQSLLEILRDAEGRVSRVSGENGRNEHELE